MRESFLKMHNMQRHYINCTVKWLKHWFHRDGRLKIPVFQDDKYHTYSPTKYAPKDLLSDYLLNSYHQDKARGSTKIRDEKLHHYFIYTGQQNFVINNGGLVQTRANQNKLKVENKNLYALLTEVWQCENTYVTVCKVCKIQGRWKHCGNAGFHRSAFFLSRLDVLK